MKRIPYATLFFAVTAGLLQYVSELSAAFQWDRQAISLGEWWRVFTGHLTHWTPSHFFWDFCVFVTLGAFVESKSRKGLLLLSALTPILSHFALVWFSNYSHYRGLSAIDNALLTYALIHLGLHSIRRRKPTYAIAAGVSLLGLLAKLGLEATRSTPLFASSLGDEVTVATISHLAGCVAGPLAALSFDFYLDIKLYIPQNARHEQHSERQRRTSFSPHVQSQQSGGEL